MMESIERLRSGLDHFYSKTVYRLIGALIVFYSVKTLLASSMFEDMTVWLIAAVIGALFYFSPGFAGAARSMSARTVPESMSLVNRAASAYDPPRASRYTVCQMPRALP